VIRWLLLVSFVLVLVGCGSSAHSPGTVPPLTTKSFKAVQAEKLAAVAKVKEAVTETKNVPAPHSGCQNAAAPAYSPDGSQIAFAGGRTVCIASRDGSHIHPVAGTSVDSAQRLAWVSPRLLLLDDGYAITAVSLTGKPQTFPRVVEAPSFSISSDGKRFATGTQSDCPGCVGQAHVWTMTGQQVGAIGSPKEYYDTPSLSPDGRRVVYAQGRAIWFSNADGSGAKQLAADGTEPLWSPAGDEIAYSNAAGLWVVSPDGGKPRLVASGATDNGGWSPNGKFIASWGRGGVEIVTVGNGKVRTYPLVGYPDYRAPAWSPDSRDILVTGRLTEHCFSLWRQPVDGSKPVLLSSCY